MNDKITITYDPATRSETSNESGLNGIYDLYFETLGEALAHGFTRCRFRIHPRLWTVLKAEYPNHARETGVLWFRRRWIQVNAIAVPVSLDKTIEIRQNGKSIGCYMLCEVIR